MSKKKPVWVDGCKVCTIGLTDAMHELVQEEGLNESEASRRVAELAGTDEFGEEIITPEAARLRYKRAIGTAYSNPPKYKASGTLRTGQKENFKEKSDRLPEFQSMSGEEFADLQEAQMAEGKKVQQNRERAYESGEVERPLTIETACEFFGFSKITWITEEALDILYKAYSKILHPDVGGSDEDMAKLNSCKNKLMEVVK